MEPFPQGFMNIRPLIIQPIDNQEPSNVNTPSASQNLDFPLPNSYNTHAQGKVSPSGYASVPHNSSTPNSDSVDQYVSPAVPQRGQNNVPFPTPHPSSCTGFVNTGKALEYSWESFDGQIVPAITSEKFIAVKIVEQKILSFFPNTFPLLTRKRPPLRSIPMKHDEINLLNSLNKRYNLGLPQFKEKDVMVRMSDFKIFYDTIRLYYPQCVKDLKSALANGTTSSRLGDTFGSGWVQINNTVLPYVKHGGNAFLPVDVIVNAAKLPVEQNMTAVLPPRLYETLNEMCTILKKNIMFDEKTEMLPLHILEQTAKDLIKFIQYLPLSDPKKYAKYIPEIGDNSSQKQHTTSTVEDVKEDIETKPLLETMNTTAANQPLTSNTCGKTTVETSQKSKVESSDPEVLKENVKPNVDTNKKDNRQLSTPSDEDGIKIDTIMCEGKDLQCLRRKAGSFVLMEALLRVFFPELTIEYFIGAVEVVLGPDIPECTSEEESAFIQVYRIPSPSLMCKKLVTTHNLEQNLSILRRMFQMAFQTDKTEKKVVKHNQGESESDAICLD